MFKLVVRLIPVNVVTETMRIRRLAILEVARQMLVDKGFDAITVRQLAEACRVSVPTLYNQFGGKDQLLAAAIEWHFVDGSDELPVVRSEPGLSRLFAILETASARLLEAPEDNRRLMQAFSSLESSFDVQQKIGARMIDFLEHELEVMRDQDCLVDWIELRLLAAQLTTAFISSATIWGSGAIADVHLTARVRFSAGLVLLGVLTPEARQQLEPRLKEAQEFLSERVELPDAISRY